ncbi:recombinase RecA [Candidatus Dojkabacteria bacterium]|jgi:recombination protein RecA|nr:recombinase RecA [Candidatus Dojkabacteria bacterium]
MSKKEKEGKEEKSSLLEQKQEILQKLYGSSILRKVGEGGIEQGTRMSTGSYLVDDAIGGGLVLGSTVEIYGPASSGKTTLALHMMASAQKRGIVAFIDAEYSFDPTYAKAVGVDVDNLYICQPDYAEQAIEVIEALSVCPEVSMVVVDSVAAMAPRAEVEAISGESSMGVMARLMSQHLRKNVSQAKKTGVNVVYINQLRKKIGVFFGSPETTTGGEALPYYAAIRLDVRKVKTLKDENKFSEGIISRVTAQKNKTAPPLRSAEITIIYGKGIDKQQEIVDLGVSTGVLEKSGAWINFGEHKLGCGVKNAIEFLKNNKPIAVEIMNKIKEKQEAGRVVLPVENQTKEGGESEE